MSGRIVLPGVLRCVAFALALCAAATLLGCGSSTAPDQPSASGCDASLWNHVYDPVRLNVIDACRTVTGTLMAHHSNEDGDIDMQVALDPPFAQMLNERNRSQLHGWLQVEAVCQAPVIRDAEAACAGFKGTVVIPADGARVQVTGSYVLDTHHGWMEIHPVTAITELR